MAVMPEARYMHDKLGNKELFPSILMGMAIWTDVRT